MKKVRTAMMENLDESVAARIPRGQARPGNGSLRAT